MGWLFEAKKRFGLSVLNYTVTSNHIHLQAEPSRRMVQRVEAQTPGILQLLRRDLRGGAQANGRPTAMATHEA